VRAGGAVVALACTGLACATFTVPIPGPTTLLVPPGLTLQAVEIAVLAGIDQRSPPPAYDPYRELPQQEFERMIDRDYLAPARLGSWFPEWKVDHVRYASVDNWQEYHLLVGIHLGTDQVRIEYVESRNMNERGGRVNERARAWIRNLAAHIEQVFAQLSRAAKPQS
jgi:hypothetical protein